MDVAADRATAEVLADLVDALLAEGLLTGIEPAGHPGDPGGGSLGGGRGAGPAGPERWVRAPLLAGGHLAFRVRPTLFPQAWRLGEPPVLWVPLGADVGRAVGPGELVRLLAGEAWASADLIAADLDDAPAAAALAHRAEPAVLAALARHGLTLRVGERLAALRDRPFHPLGRHKRGWSHADARRWGPHARRPFGLDWWAVPHAWVDAGGPPTPSLAGPAPAPPGDALAPAAGDPLAPAHALDGPAGVLAREDRRALAAAARRALGDRRGYVALPVHPWQARHLAHLLGTPDDGGPVALARGIGAFRATASLRTVVPAGRADVHLKLPLGVAALGAGRELPLRYLRNGLRAQHLLTTVAGHPALAGRLDVCDESSWWVTTGEDGAAAVAEGELGCQVRRLPPRLVDDRAVALVPLAALGVAVDGTAPAVDALVAARARATRAAGPGDRTAAGADVLGALTSELVRLATVCLAHGLMPEAHGQNVVVVVRGGEVAGLVLRDHDAVRVHRPWLLAAGLPDPGYVVDGRTPNTLSPATPEALLAWFQMLGVHVGLHPVALALGASGLDEAAGWGAIAAATRRTLDVLDGWADLRPAVAVARHELLERRDWPLKLVMGPLLSRGDACGTSMPSAIGRATNPLRAPAGVVG